jgi:DNA-binding winged helix-turn-helix (wHTH) protein/tetratricopeptide (TPR) repeat protein
MNDLENVIYEFAGRRVDPARRQLLHDGRPVVLFPRCFDALLLLVERRGELLDKEFLLRSLWPDVEVDENSLAKVISEVRRALGEGPKDPGCIATVTRRGYRFVADVAVRRELASPVTGGSPRGATSHDAGLHSLAVLPFTFLNPVSGDEFLGLGLADALTTRLGHLRHTLLRPTSSIARFAAGGVTPADAGRQLNVHSVIAGSIRRSLDMVRVTVQLISVANDAVSWAEKFDADTTDSLALEDSVAQRVADALTLALTRGDTPPVPRRYTNNLTAYEHFIRGRYQWSKRTRACLLQAIDSFERAIAIDPQYALAYSGLGDCWAQLGVSAAVSQSMRPHETMPKARAAAERAVALDDTLAAAHATLGQVLFVYEWKRTEGLQHLRRAMELEPNHPSANHWYAMALASLGRLDEALVQIQRAREIDPLSVIVNANIGFILYRAARYDEAIAQLRHAVAMEPTSVMARYRLGLAYGGKGMHEAALTEFAAMNPSASDPLGYTGMARSYAFLGRRKEALALLDTLRGIMRHEYVAAALLADIHVALGDHERAFEFLDLAIEERGAFSIWPLFDRNWDVLRDDARFPALMKRIGLPLAAA